MLFRSIIAVTLLLGLGVTLSGCSKEEPSAEEVNAVVAERSDLNEEQAARVQPVTAVLYGERKALRKLRADVQDEVLAQLTSDSGRKSSCEGKSGGWVSSVDVELSCKDMESGKDKATTEREDSDITEAGE